MKHTGQSVTAENQMTYEAHIHKLFVNMVLKLGRRTIS